MDANSSGAAGYSTEGGRHPGTTLTDAAVRLWPTPDAQAINDSEEPDTWLDRREREKAKGQNGNGMGTPLAMAAKLWASPTASDGNSRTTDPETNREGTLSLTGQALLWATPMAMDGVKPSAGKRAADDLTHQAALWGTPRANDWKDDSPGSAPVNGFLSRQVQASETPGQPSSPSDRTSPRRLNPAFVCWLMGWPEGWSDAGRSLAPTSFAGWETVSSRWLLRWRSSSSPRGLG